MRCAGKDGGYDIELTYARLDARSDAIAAELARNMDLARSLGFTGTPSWVAEGRIVQGAVGYDTLKAALEGKGAA